MGFIRGNALVRLNIPTARQRLIAGFIVGMVLAVKLPGLIVSTPDAEEFWRG